ncbi:uncharacterized protein LOC141616897 [Silene latifolia]|uniref:uncharacterized protein LOC141616897 n=1 Tax=Silene latifolia TaxID=37657 RepID=UPI003D7722DE
MFQKTLILDNSKLNIGAGLTFRQVKELVNGYENIGATLIDFKNFQRDIKCYIGLRDADLFIDRLEKLKATQPQFYFAYDVDPQNRLTKFFWADATCIRNYSFFGDLCELRPYLRNQQTSSAIHEGAMIITNDHSFPELKTELPIEKHGAIIYTHAVFKVFQEEVMAADSCGVDDFEKEEHVRIIHVIDAETDRIFKVYKGKGIGRIPSKYIVDRWLNNTHAAKIVGVLKTLPAEHTEELASLLVEFLRSYVLNRLQKTKRWRSLLGCSSSSEVTIHPPEQARNKGSGKRLKSAKQQAIEKAAKPKRLCAYCKERVTHDRRTCPLRIADVAAEKAAKKKKV